MAFVRVETVGMFCVAVCWLSAVAEVVPVVSRITRSSVTDRASARCVLAVQSQTTHVADINHSIDRPVISREDGGQCTYSNNIGLPQLK